ncbi:MAG: hypothetical protein ABIE74_04970 [Pseudomonadota bacterium]
MVKKQNKFAAFLSAAWPGIRVIGEKIDFQNAWKELIEKLDKIDNMFV